MGSKRLWFDPPQPKHKTRFHKYWGNALCMCLLFGHLVLRSLVLRNVLVIRFAVGLFGLRFWPARCVRCWFSGVWWWPGVCGMAMREDGPFGAWVCRAKRSAKVEVGRWNEAVKRERGRWNEAGLERWFLERWAINRNPPVGWATNPYPQIHP